MSVVERIERVVNPLPDHLALIECRRENVRLNRERAAYLARHRGALEELALELEGWLDRVRELMR